MPEHKFYWIKLQTNFYESNEKIDYLMSQKGGSNYVVLYQMLCLKTVNNGGNLSCKVGEVIVPFDVDKIVRDCKYFSKDTVIIALTLYKRLGLIYEERDGTLQIAEFEQLVGSESKWASFKRKERERIGQSLDNVQQMSTQMSNKSIEYRDKSIEIDIENRERESVSNDTVRHRFVKPTVEEVAQYCQANNYNVDAEQFVDFYESKGWKVGSQPMKDWKACVRTWVKRDAQSPKKSAGESWLDELAKVEVRV